jgi:DNA-binding transcriptional LysR family regulator
MVAGRLDAGIRVGKRLEKGMIAVRLAPDIKMIAVASPQYLAHHGELRESRSSNSTPSTRRGTGIAARLTGARAGIGISGPTTPP